MQSSQKTDTSVSAARFRFIQTLPIVISFVALSISVASFYYQFVYVSEDLRATLLWSSVSDKAWRGTLILVNNGNRPAIMQEAFLVVEPKDNQENVDSPIKISRVISLAISPSIPVTIKPKDVVVVTLTGEFDVLKYFSYGSPYKDDPKSPFRTTLESRGARELKTTLEFSALNSTGTGFRKRLSDLTLVITKEGLQGQCGGMDTVDVFRVDQNGNQADHRKPC